MPARDLSSMFDNPTKHLRRQTTIMRPAAKFDGCQGPVDTRCMRQRLLVAENCNEVVDQIRGRSLADRPKKSPRRRKGLCVKRAYRRSRARAFRMDGWSSTTAIQPGVCPIG